MKYRILKLTPEEVELIEDSLLCSVNLLNKLSFPLIEKGTKKYKDLHRRISDREKDINI